MPSLNNVTMIGHLTRDPEKRFLPSGTSVVNFGIAVNRKWGQGDQQREEVCFIDIAVFGKPGDWLIENGQTHKGTAVTVHGYLKFDTWEGTDGSKKSKHSIVAFTVVPAAGRAQGSSGAGQQTAPPTGNKPMTDDDIPF